MVLIGFILIVVGLIGVFVPYFFWYLSVGWQLKDAEPSEETIIIRRVGGVIAVIIGLIIMISSCTSEMADYNWPKQFKNKLEAGEVQTITIGSTSPETLTTEETAELTRLIQNAYLRAYDRDDMFGSIDTGEIVFKDQTRVELVIWGQSGGIELHPTDTPKKYVIESDQVNAWFRAHHSN